MAEPIVTPRGTIIPGDQARLEWNTSFGFTWTGRFSRAQVFLDSEILRLCEPFIPLRTSMLIKSGLLGTVPGSGLIAWLAQYAKAQYYSPRPVGSQTGPLRGPFWFDRGFQVWGKGVVERTARIAGGGR